MKYIIFIILYLIFTGQILAADNEGGIMSENSSNSSVINNGFSGQKQISDSKFKKTIEQMKERSLSKKQKKLREQIKPNSPLIDEEHLKNFAQDTDEELSQTLTVMIPVKAYNDEGKTIQPGYYKLSCRKTSENKYVLDLSQGSKRIMSVEANQTKDDLEQDTIHFVNAQVIPNGRIRLVYGNIDLNLVAYIYYD